MPLQLQIHSFNDLWHPWVFAWILLVQVAYLVVTGPMREAYNWGAPLPTIRKIYFSIGLWLVYVAEGTPMHILAESYLFSFHMIQHIILTSITPPLVLLGITDWMARPVIRWRPAYYFCRFFSLPFMALITFNLIYSIWHMPIAYQSTLWWHWFHMVQHAILVLFAFFNWMPLLSPLPEIPRLGYAMQMFYIFLVGMTQVVVFGVITFADEVLYDFYAQAPRIWPWLDPLLDQQISGVIMKVGGMAIALVAWGIIFFKWAEESGLGIDKHGHPKLPVKS